MFKRMLFLFILGLSIRFTQAAVNVVATTSSMGMLTRTIGGDAVKITTLAPPDRDAHYLQAKPSMILALRRADLLVAVGAELEIGWLPAAVSSASNPRILPGKPGYFEGAAQLALMEAGQAADRSRGDIHPMGNPHIYMDPARMAKVGQALANRLASFDSAHAEMFKANAAKFTQEAEARVKVWQQQVAGAPGVVLYHKDANYLLALLKVPILGYIEPVPGIPPTGEHLRELVEQLKGQKGAILFTEFQSDQGPNFLARNLGWKVARLPLEAPLDADSSAYLDLIDRWVKAVQGGKS